LKLKLTNNRVHLLQKASVLRKMTAGEATS